MSFLCFCLPGSCYFSSIDSKADFCLNPFVPPRCHICPAPALWFVHYISTTESSPHSEHCTSFSTAVSFQSLSQQLPFQVLPILLCPSKANNGPAQSCVRLCCPSLKTITDWESFSLGAWLWMYCERKHSPCWFLQSTPVFLQSTIIYNLDLEADHLWIHCFKPRENHCLSCHLNFNSMESVELHRNGEKLNFKSSRS